MHIVVMGCGRVGASLATALGSLDHQVSVIDHDPEAFRRLDPGFTGSTVTGVGFDRAVLERAGIAEADAFAAVSSGDNSNIISARVAKESFGVATVVARIYDARRAAVYERLGIPTVATVPWTTDRFLRTLLPEGTAATWRDPTGTVALVAPQLHEGWVGRKIRQLETTLGTRSAFVMRFGTGVIPTPETIIQAEDTVYLAALSGTVNQIGAIAAQPPEEDA